VKVTNRELWTSGLLYGDPAKLGAHDPGPRKAYKQPEQAILNAVLTRLRAHPLVAWVVRINTGAYKTPDGRFIRFGFPGCPDLIGMMKTGAFLAIEIKSAAGQVTAEQRAVIDKVREHGGVAGVARSQAEAVRIVEGLE
jgi:hypothetical protein